MRKDGKRIRASSVLLTAVMVALSVAVLFPFYVMVIMGTYFTNNLFKGLPILPSNYLMENLKTIVNASFGTFYFNSLYISVLVTFLTLLVSGWAGYGFAMYRFRGARFLLNFCLGMMMVPAQLGIIAFAVEIKNLGWSDTHLPLIVPPAASIFAMYWLYNYTKENLPMEVIESARVDGCGEFHIYFSIALPFLRTAMLSIGMLTFLWSWNAFLTPLVVLTRTHLFTIPLGIKTLDLLFRVDTGAQILALAIGTIPIMVFFSFFSKSLIRGLSSVAVKG